MSLPFLRTQRTQVQHTRFLFRIYFVWTGQSAIILWFDSGELLRKRNLSQETEKRMFTLSTFLINLDIQKRKSELPNPHLIWLRLYTFFNPYRSVLLRTSWNCQFGNSHGILQNASYQNLHTATWSSRMSIAFPNNLFFCMQKSFVHITY